MSYHNDNPRPIEHWRQFFFGGREFLRDVVTCGGCGYSFLNAVEPDAAAFYKQQDTEEAVRLRPFRQRYFAEIRRWIALPESANPGVAPRVLDLGSGDGAWLDQWQGQAERSATELSPEHRTALQDRGIQLVDASNLQGQYDVVSLFDFLEHVEDPRSLLHSIGHVVAPQGTLVIGVPDMGKLIALLLGPRYYLVCPMHFSYFTRSALESLLTATFPGARATIRPSPPMNTDLRGLAKWIGLERFARSVPNATLSIGYRASLIAIVRFPG